MDCDSGQGYDIDGASCEPCPIGTYRTQGTHDVCQRCPIEFITPVEGAIASTQCTVGMSD